MPADPFSRACLVAGCARPPHSRGRCQAHARQADELRGLTADRHLGAALYASSQWRALRAAVLALNPWCQCADCAASGRYHKATVIHHREPHGGDSRLFFAPSNLQALAKPCHDRLTAAGGRALESLKSRPAAKPRGRDVRPAPGLSRGSGG